jgi:hypothetical protein
MSYKKKLIILFIVVLLISAVQYLFPYHPEYVDAYDKFIFRPYQSLRDIVFGFIPLSIGDIFYVVFAIAIIVALYRWLYYAARVRTYKHRLGHSLLRGVVSIGILYVLFFIGWGGNYYKPTLTEYWKLDKITWAEDSTLFAFDEYLVKQINHYAPQYRAVPFKDLDKRAKRYYIQYTNGKARQFGLNAKASMFGFWMQHFGIQGYYNPFTGEAQVNKYLPSFMLPYVIAHEMAHQSGIAAEEDANLMAYVVGTQANDVAFRYSAYFNLWLYTNARVRMADSVKANLLKDQLNPITQSHIDTLLEIRRRYRSVFSKYSGEMYDSYLKLHNQKDGIRSYNRVSSSAWAWEQRKLKDTVIHLP